MNSRAVAIVATVIILFIVLFAPGGLLAAEPKYFKWKDPVTREDGTPFTHAEIKHYVLTCDTTETIIPKSSPAGIYPIDYSSMLPGMGTTLCNLKVVDNDGLIGHPSNSVEVIWEPSPPDSPTEFIMLVGMVPEVDPPNGQIDISLDILDSNHSSRLSVVNKSNRVLTSITVNMTNAKIDTLVRDGNNDQSDPSVGVNNDDLLYSVITIPVALSNSYTLTWSMDLDDVTDPISFSVDLVFDDGLMVSKEIPNVGDTDDKNSALFFDTVKIGE